MSGIAGLVHLDGSPIDRALLDRMTASLAFRGPDAVHTWVGGNVGFGHTLLRTTEESANEHQPFTLGQQAWIVADARIDARDELVAKLVAKGRAVSLARPDVELILHTYHVWGEDCVDHLLGDFSFAIWDASQRRLFCARDHFGVNQLHYARLGNRLIFSNSLNCVRLDPSVSGRLDDFSIGDFLALGFNSDPTATAFAEIRRLAPAHLLSATDAALKLRRYWTVPVEDEIRYRRESDYVDQFRELLGRAVHDRLRVPRATVLMSGGLDSSSVAAFAATAAPSGQDRLKAFTLFHRKLIPDREPHFAGLVAQALRIPIQYLEVDRYNLFDGWEDGTYCPAEPHPDPLNALLLDFLTQALTFSRIVLTGQGGDPALGSSVSHYAFLLLRERRLGRLFHDFGHFLLSEGRASRLYLATRWRVLRDRHQKPPDPPQWLNAEFSSRFPYSERYGRVFEGAASPHRLRPYAHRGLSSPVWPDQFALYDPDATGVPVQFAHPYFDIRLIRALLRFPPVPWCTDKEIVRVALRGMLPDSVRLRRKSPLVEDVISILLRSRGHWWQHLPAAPGTERYLRWDRLPCPNQVGADEAWPFVRAVGLNLWMMAQNGSHPSSRPDGLTLAPGPPLPP